MLAIRVPVSALGGALFSAALFLGLWQLVNVPLVAGPRLRKSYRSLPACAPTRPSKRRALSA